MRLLSLCLPRHAGGLSRPVRFRARGGPGPRLLAARGIFPRGPAAGAACARSGRGARRHGNAGRLRSGAVSCGPDADNRRCPRMVGLRHHGRSGAARIAAAWRSSAAPVDRTRCPQRTQPRQRKDPAPAAARGRSWRRQGCIGDTGLHAAADDCAAASIRVADRQCAEPCARCPAPGRRRRAQPVDGHHRRRRHHRARPGAGPGRCTIPACGSHCQPRLRDAGRCDRDRAAAPARLLPSPRLARPAPGGGDRPPPRRR